MININYYSNSSLSEQLKKAGLKFNEAKITQYSTWVRYLQALYDNEIITMEVFDKSCKKINRLIIN